MKLKQLIKNFSYTIFSNLISLGVSTILVLFVPKFVGVEQYGYWQLYLFYTTYVGVLTFGWVDGIYLRYGGKRYSELDKKLFHSQFVMALILQIIIFAVIVVCSLLMSNDDRQFILIMVGICLVLFNTRGFVLYILQDTNRIKEYATVNTIGRVLYFALVIFALFIDKRNYRSLIIADLIGRLFSLGFGVYIIRDIVFQKTSNFYWSFHETWLNISVGIKLLIANFAGMLILGVVRYGIQAFWGVATFGKVSLTLSISNLLMTFISAISLVLYPMLRRMNRQKIQLMYLEIREILMVVLFLGLFIYYPINYLLPLWLPKYSNSLIYMALLFPMCIYQGKFELLINTFMKTFRYEKALLRINLFSVFFSIVVTSVNVLLIHKLDILMFSIILILWVQSNLGEFYLTYQMNIHIIKDIILETIMILVFMFSSWRLLFPWSIFCYSSVLLVYLVLKHKKIINGFRMFRDNLSD